jgi:CRISPR-associated protein Csd1
MTMLQGLVGYYKRLEHTGVVAPRGYSEADISFAVVLDLAGTVVDVDDLRDHRGRKPQARSLLVPAPPAERSGKKRVSAFLWDNSKYALGIGRDKTGVILTPEQFQEFARFHLELLRAASEAELLAFRAFVQSWRPERHRSLRYGGELSDTKIVFRLNGETSFVHESEAGKRIWDEITGKKDGQAEAGICLITGERRPIARLHPDISHVAGQRNVGPLVSFNEEAFESYGKSQGANAPVSVRAAHAYGTALNTLLSLKEGVDAKGRPRWKNRVQIGDASTVFWAEAEGGPEAAEQAEVVFSWTLDPPVPTDEEEAAKVQSVLQKIERGRPLEEIDELGGKLHPETSFYVLGLSPNAARLAVRFFLQSTLRDVIRHAGQHYQDLLIEPHLWTVPPALWRLLRETAPQRETDNVSPALAGELARAVLTGGHYPRALLALTLMRIRADGEVNDLRAGICKACVARDYRQGFQKEGVPVSLDRSESNPSYRLGRLFAILERAQYAALGHVNANIRDKYFSSASANPARVFPLLLRGVQDHLGKSKSEGRRWARLLVRRTDCRGHERTGLFATVSEHVTARRPGPIRRRLLPSTQCGEGAPGRRRTRH